MATAVLPRTTLVGAWRGRVAAAVGVLAAVVGVSVMTLGGAWIVAERAPWVSLVHLTALLVVAAASVVVADRHSAAAQGLALYAATLAAVELAMLTALPDRAQLILSATGLVGVLAAACVSLGWHTPPRGLLLLTGSLAMAGFVVLVGGFNPLHEPQCPVACPEVSAMAEQLMDSRSAVTVAAGLSLAAVALTGSAMSTVLSTAGVPSMPLLVAVAGPLAATSSAAPFAIRALGWDASYDVRTALVLPSVGGTVLGTAVLVAAFVEAHARAGAARVVELVNGLDDGSVAADAVQFAVPGEDRWVDAAGRPMPAADGYVLITHRGAPLARIASPDRRPGLDEDHLGPARLLAVRNAQLAAVAKLRVEELQASRRRIVDISDAEDRRIERDLHDGAQQRLVSSMLYLAVARDSDPRLVELHDAEKAILGALNHLRSLAQGIYPEILRSEGVWAALEDLAHSLPVPVQISWAEPLKPPESVGHALFAATSRVLEVASAAPSASRIELRAESSPMRVVLHVLVVDKTLAILDLVDAEDRLGALGGRLAIRGAGAETTLILELPCAS